MYIIKNKEKLFSYSEWRYFSMNVILASLCSSNQPLITVFIAFSGVGYLAELFICPRFCPAYLYIPKRLFRITEMRIWCNLGRQPVIFSLFANLHFKHNGRYIFSHIQCVETKYKWEKMWIWGSIHYKTLLMNSLRNPTCLWKIIRNSLRNSNEIFYDFSVQIVCLIVFLIVSCKSFSKFSI